MLNAYHYLAKQPAVQPSVSALSQGWPEFASVSPGRALTASTKLVMALGTSASLSTWDIRARLAVGLIAYGLYTEISVMVTPESLERTSFQWVE